MRFEYSLHAPLRGRAAARTFTIAFSDAFPYLGFEGTADLIAEGNHVVGQWIGGGTDPGWPMTGLPLGGLLRPANRTAVRS